MQGRRLPDAIFGREGGGWDYYTGEQAQPGDYLKVDYDGRIEWWIRDPAGVVGRLTTHTVTEHDDGTITVSPSIFDAPNGWHGWLEHGAWRSA